MENEEFRQLLPRPEDDLIDFKAKVHDFSGSNRDDEKVKRALFVKDIVCMANTPRDQDAYLVFGVKKHLDGTYDLVGLTSHPDDAVLQEKVKDYVYPHPRFSYSPVNLDGKSFGVLTIPPDRSLGPFLPTVDVAGTLRRNQLYFRRNSRNSEADGAEQKNIFSWFMQQNRPSHLETTSESSWNQFVDAVEGMSAGRTFGLAISPYQTVTSAQLETIGFVDWAFVIDFDHESESHGVLAACRNTIEPRRTVHRMTLGDAPASPSSRGTYWYFARGITGRETSLRLGTWKSWQQSYDADIRRHLAILSKQSASQPTTLIVLWNSPELVPQLDSLLSATSSAFGESINIVIVSENADDYRSMAEKHGSLLFNFPLDHFCQGLASLRPTGDSGRQHEMSIPSSSGVAIVPSTKDRCWLEEELDVLYNGIGQVIPSEQSPGKAFLSGHEISWFDLGLHYDVDREITLDVMKQIRKDLSKRKPERVNLYHGPGAGGTTVARRILWDCHYETPCAVLRRTNPRQTVERLSFLYSETRKPCLVMLDGSEISEAQSNVLFEELESRHIPVVLLQTLRRFERVRRGERSFFVENELTRSEILRFVHILSREAPQAAEALTNLANSPHRNEKTPFILGITAFGRSFRSLNNYVHERCTTLTVAQVRVLIYMAIAHYYGQKAIPAQALAEVLQVPRSKRVDLNAVLTPTVMELLVQAAPGYWRTAHHLIAEEILQHLLSKGETDRRLWKQRLSECGIEFASFCRGSLPQPSNDLLELAKRVFVFRDNLEPLGNERSASKQFSQFIGDIPVPQGRQQVLEKLTELFPEEAHFWAHLGRFHFLERDEYDEAIACIDQAIVVEPNDNVLQHIKGMALRGAAYWHIERQHEFDIVLEYAKRAAESFSLARKLSDSDEYGYISEVQMVIRVLDYYGRIRETTPIEAVGQSHDPWVLGALEHIEDLLSQVRNLRISRGPSEYEQNCRGHLDALYGDHGKALQKWDELLNRQGPAKVYAPPIRRQIIWTYLHVSRRRWEELGNKQLKRSVELLQENLQEDPYNEKDLRLWMQAIRYLQDPPSMDSIIEKVAHWKIKSETLEACFYLYVLYALESFAGSSVSTNEAIRALKECQERSRYRIKPTYSFEWLGNGQGIAQLVHHARIGEWDRERDMWTNTSLLKRLEGVITHIDGPQAGKIETPGGLSAFFVPVRSNHHKGRSENSRVSFYLGFSYDGLRAWSVEDV
jgi:tetratricopeptide (TPR) repeat protein